MAANKRKPASGKTVGKTKASTGKVPPSAAKTSAKGKPGRKPAPKSKPKAKSRKASSATSTKTGSRAFKPKLTRENLSGWGRSDSAWSLGYTPDSLESLTSVASIKTPQLRIARGLGRAYGDAALVDGGMTVHFDRLDRAVSFDSGSGLLVAEAGMRLNDILHLAVPRGWFLPVTPGTAHPTLGGSIACDVHGKNHHKAGTISAHLQWLELITAEGELVRCSPKRNKSLFFATTGGLGLTGLIYRAALQLMKIETSWIHEESYRVDNLRDMMARLTASDATHPYTVAWMDGATSGAHLGQGQVLLGRHAKLSELNGKASMTPLSAHNEGAIAVPLTPPFSFVNNLSLKAFNALRIQMSSRRGKRRLVPYRPFFYPLDVADNWNRIYGPRGFYQYQYVVPFENAEKVLRETIVRLQKAGTPGALIVLKRFGEEGEGMLSFPKPGWTIAIDIPVSPKLDSVLDELDALLVEAEGRIYLVKDARLKSETFRRMYPRFGEWLKVKQKVDPEWRFSSNLSRRLKLEEGV